MNKAKAESAGTISFARHNPSSMKPDGGQRLAVVGGLLAALAASSCCILPLVLFALGIGGAWIGNLTALAPYQPYFLGFAALSLSYGYFRVWKARQAACSADMACARPLPNRFVLAGLIAATALIAAAISFNLLAPLFL